MKRMRVRDLVLLGGTVAAALWLGQSFFPSVVAAQASSRPAGARPQAPLNNEHVAAGDTLFQQRCAFCHGRDASGGESGPDLTRSRIVLNDVNGSTIADVVRNGRAGRMPPFQMNETEMSDLVSFIHAQQQKARLAGNRKGVDVADLQTGNVAAGKQYFEGAGTCSKCHSATGDLAHIATKYQGLQLEIHMLYPRDAKGKATVTLPSGEKLTGTIEYHDEFYLGIKLQDGSYRSWPVSKIHYTIDAPHEAHAELFSKYTDDDIHNLMAYLQTLR